MSNANMHLDPEDSCTDVDCDGCEPNSHEAGDHAPLPDPDCDRCNDTSN